MHRTSGIALAGVFIAFAPEAPRAPLAGASAETAAITRAEEVAWAGSQVSTPERAGSAAAQDVASVLAAARGVSPIMCSLAAQAVWGGGWGGWYDAPASPVASEMSARIRDLDRQKFAPSEVRVLLDSLASSDGCVREMAVRLLGRQRDEAVVSGLVERLGGGTPELREVAALGLGFVEPKTAVEPLLRALRDAAPGVRANSAWALG